MMKMSEVKSATNADLILCLSYMILSTRISKSEQRCAKWIFYELEERGIIENATNIYAQWNDIYMA